VRLSGRKLPRILNITTRRRQTSSCGKFSPWYPFHNRLYRFRCRLEAMAKREISSPAGNRIPSVLPVASHYTDWLLALASTVILGSETHGTHAHILPSDCSGSLQTHPVTIMTELFRLYTRTPWRIDVQSLALSTNIWIWKVCILIRAYFHILISIIFIRECCGVVVGTSALYSLSPWFWYRSGDGGLRFFVVFIIPHLFKLFLFNPFCVPQCLASDFEYWIVNLIGFVREK
jgi:hypothetical protein